MNKKLILILTAQFAGLPFFAVEDGRQVDGRGVGLAQRLVSIATRGLRSLVGRPSIETIQAELNLVDDQPEREEGSISWEDVNLGSGSSSSFDSDYEDEGFALETVGSTQCPDSPRSVVSSAGSWEELEVTYRNFVASSVARRFITEIVKRIEVKKAEYHLFQGPWSESGFEQSRTETGSYKEGSSELITGREEFDLRCPPLGLYSEQGDESEVEEWQSVILPPERIECTDSPRLSLEHIESDPESITKGYLNFIYQRIAAKNGVTLYEGQWEDDWSDAQTLEGQPISRANQFWMDYQSYLYGQPESFRRKSEPALRQYVENSDNSNSFVFCECSPRTLPDKFHEIELWSVERRDKVRSPDEQDNSSSKSNCQSELCDFDPFE